MASSIWCQNHQMFEKFMEIVREELADVNFIFESNGINNDNNATGPPAKKVARKGWSTVVGSDVGNVIKISANRKVLAASSPVFNAMFNGPLKETGDVKIADATPDAFREFLQIFYENNVTLKAGNLVDVMKLIDKYDVEAAWPIINPGFKRFTVNDILWGLHLAVKFRRDDLIAHCMNVIEQNIVQVFDMIEIDDSGKPKLRSNPNNRPMTDNDLANIYSRIHTMIKKYISESIPIKATGIVSLKLLRSFWSMICKMQNVSFSSNRTLILTRISYGEIRNRDGFSLQCKVKVNIGETETCHFIPKGGGSIECVNPVMIQANRKYTIQTTIITGILLDLTFSGYHIPREPVQVASDIKITFDNAHSHSFVTGMNFLRCDQ